MRRRCTQRTFRRTILTQSAWNEMAVNFVTNLQLTSGSILSITGLLGHATASTSSQPVHNSVLNNVASWNKDAGVLTLSLDKFTTECI